MGEKRASPAVKAARAQTEAQSIAATGSTGRVHLNAATGALESVNLTLLLDELANQPVRVVETLPQDYVTDLLGDQDEELGWKTTGPMHIALELKREAELYRARGTVDLKLQTACVRCLNDIRLPVHLDMDVRLMKSDALDTLPQDDEFVMDPERMAEWAGGAAMGLDDEESDADLMVFTEERIDVAEVVRQQLVLELPSYPSCDHEGVEKDEPCGFSPEKLVPKGQKEWIDPRLEGLMALKAQLPDAES